MTLNDIKTEIMSRVGLTSTDDDTRIARAINIIYRNITSGLRIKHLSRRTTTNATTSIGVSTLQFTSAEKVVEVYNRNTSPYVQLEEVSIDELRREQPYTTSDTPTRYAIKSVTADTVTIELNCIPQTAFALYADVYSSAATLTGSDEPAFPESFHGILIDGVLVDEYMKAEKPGLSALAEKRYKERMGELQLWNSVSTTKKLYQGKTAQGFAGAGSAGGSGSSVNGALSYTQTGLITFDRSAAGDVAPFAVDADADAVVTNLDADKVDGFHASSFAKLDVANAGSLLFVDATHDIGASGATRPRDLFLSRNATIGGTLGVTGNTTLSGTLGVTGVATFTAAPVFNGGITLPTLTQNLLFTDATYDIGASGATRPRDLWLSRNAEVGGTVRSSAGSAFTSTNASGVMTFTGGTAPEITFTGIEDATPGIISSNGSVSVSIDKDNDSTLAKFTVRANNSTDVFSVSEVGAGVFADSLTIAATKELLLDGGGDTSIRESSGNVIQIKAGGTDVLRISSSAVHWNDNANANNSFGLTVNQLAADDEVLSFKSSDVAHTMTNITEGDTYGWVKKANGPTGGLTIEGMMETSVNHSALWLTGTTVDAGDTTKATTSNGHVRISAYEQSGAGRGNATANSNLMVIQNNATTRFIFDADGDSHQDVGTAWTNFDHIDDLKALDAMAVVLHTQEPDALRTAFVSDLEESKAYLESIPGKPVITFNEDGHHFANMSRVTMLHHGAIRYLGRQMKEENEMLRAELDALKSQMKLLKDRN